MQTILRRQVGPHARLAFFDDPHEEEGWDAEWAQYRAEDIPALIEYFRGDVVLGEAFARWLRPGGRVLEAGCGFGYWVSILAERGYRAVGLDFSPVALRTGRERLRDVDLLLGNILQMPFPEGAFDGVVSLGVVEHFEEGPDAALRELHRVIHLDGMLLLAVPYVSPARRIASRPAVAEEGSHFHQWAFTKEEMIGRIEAAGFSIAGLVPYGAIKTLSDEVGVLRRLRDRMSSRKPGGAPVRKAPSSAPGWKQLFRRRVLEIAPLRYLAAHMMLYAARRR